MRHRVLIFALLAAMSATAARAQVLADNGFTYQGRLTDAGAAPTGLYDIQFTLWDASSGGAANPTINTVDNVLVSAGLFTARLDFGTAFASYKRWLQIAVRPGASVGAYTTLLPRQEITAAPFSTFSLAPWVNIPGAGIQYNTGFSVSVGAAPTFADRMLVSADASNVNGIHGTSNSPILNAAGVQGDGSGSNNPIGVYGTSYVQNGAGVVGKANTTGGYFEAYSSSGSPVGVYARANVSGGVGLSASGQSYGIFTLCPANIALYADGNIGVQGIGIVAGVDGGATTGVGVRGTAAGSQFTGFGDGVVGQATGGVGVRGSSGSGRGVVGISTSAEGVSGDCTSAGTYGFLGHPTVGVFGSGGSAHWGVRGDSVGPGIGAAALFAYNSNPSGIALVTSTNSGDANTVIINTGAGDLIRCFSGGGGGNQVFTVTNCGTAIAKVIQIQGGCDVAEPFHVHKTADQPAIEPGMVVAIDPDNPGSLMLTERPYDTRVAGIISGANGLAPGLTLSSDDHAIVRGEHAVAMSGRVWCRVDASFGEIHPGDSLTTSSIAGTAMRAAETSQANGASIGKAMTGLKEGRGVVLVLVNLH